MAHEGDNGGAKFEIFGFVDDRVIDIILDRGFGRDHDRRTLATAFFQFQLVTMLATNTFRHLFIDGLVDVCKNAQLHQVGNQLERFAFDLLSQFANHDRRLDGNGNGVVRGDKFGRCTGWRPSLVSTRVLLGWTAAITAGLIAIILLELASTSRAPGALILEAAPALIVTTPIEIRTLSGSGGGCWCTARWQFDGTHLVPWTGSWLGGEFDEPYLVAHLWRCGCRRGRRCRRGDRFGYCRRL